MKKKKVNKHTHDWQYAGNVFSLGKGTIGNWPVGADEERFHFVCHCGAAKKVKKNKE